MDVWHKSGTGNKMTVVDEVVPTVWACRYFDNVDNEWKTSEFNCIELVNKNPNSSKPLNIPPNTNRY